MINKTFPITEKLLTDGLNLSLKLLDQLNKEADNLKHRTDPVTLTDLSVNKKETVSQLNQFSIQLSQILSTEKLEMSPSGLAEYFKKAEAVNLNTRNASNYWNEILSISKKCRVLNEINGASINLLVQHSKRSLHILKGKLQQPTTYSSDGSPQRELFSHPLISV